MHEYARGCMTVRTVSPAHPTHASPVRVCVCVCVSPCATSPPLPCVTDTTSPPPPPTTPEPPESSTDASLDKEINNLRKTIAGWAVSGFRDGGLMSHIPFAAEFVTLCINMVDVRVHDDGLAAVRTFTHVTHTVTHTHTHTHTLFVSLSVRLW